uniref:Uncharacterized protein n=1 Tax=Timema tahoe TaxID=61484 RepID=A0A7R9IFL4_9NEOP|nr:unnamed protein product [Timema tahoe]
MFNKGYFMLAFDLTPDTPGQDLHTSLQTEGNVRFKLQFKTNHNTAITCLFYPEYEGTVSIDSNREPLLLPVCRCQGRWLEPDEIHRPVINHQLVQERPTGIHAVQTSPWQLSKMYAQGCPDVCSSIGYKRSSVQTQTAMEKVTCSGNVAEDHLPSEDSQPSLVTRTFYLNDKHNKHVAVGLFPSRNFYTHVMFSSNSKRLILTVPQ